LINDNLRCSTGNLVRE